MIKKLITSAAIIAASTALANAATFTYDSSAITDAANSAISVSGTSGSGYGSYTVTLVLDADAFVSAVADGTGVTFASVQGSGGAQFSYECSRPRLVYLRNDVSVQLRSDIGNALGRFDPC